MYVDDSRVFWNPDMKVGQDLSILAQLCIFWGMTFVSFNRMLMKPIARFFINDAEVRPADGKPKSKLETHEDVRKLRHKFVTSLWKFITYASFIAYGIYAVNFEQSWFWSPQTYCQVFPRGSFPSLLYWYYQLETSYYLFSLGLLAWEPKMKDRAQMMVHHFVTISLLVTSYIGRMVKFGVPIMLLHDAADPFMELAKMFLYCGKEGLANASLAIFTATFMYLRNWVFPRHIIWTLYSNPEGHIYPYFNITLVCLCTLAVLHVYWAGLILKIGYKNFVSGQPTGDIREED